MKDQILDDVQAPVGIGTLGNDADATSNLDRMVDDVFAGDRGMARCRGNPRRENTQGRSLTGAVGPQQSEELPLANVEIEALERDDIRAGKPRRSLTSRAHRRWPATSAPTPLWRRGRGIHFAKRLRLDGERRHAQPSSLLFNNPPSTPSAPRPATVPPIPRPLCSRSCGAAAMMRSARRENGMVWRRMRPGPRRRTKNKPSPPNSAVLIPGTVSMS